MIQNIPDLWISLLPHRKPGGHKYDYGHALIYAAPELTGATSLAAQSCARIGAGLVTVLAGEERADLYRTILPPHILVRGDLSYFDPRVTARLYGSGGLPKGVKLSLNRPAVLDADALSALPETLHEQIVLTPHEGEFARTFPGIQGSREGRALEAAQKSGAVIVLKGQGTLIAHPGGRIALNEHDTPYLATAGTGDVLAGMITGLLAQGMPAFEAACAAVWIHGACGLKTGPGLVADDLPQQIPAIMQDFS